MPAMEYWQQLTPHLKTLWRSIGFRLSLGYLAVFLSGILLIWVFVSNILNQLIEETVDEYGKTVAEQLAQSSVDNLVRGDLVSLQIQLDNLTNLDTVISAAIYDVENRTLVQAGSTPNSRKEINQHNIRNFPATITFDKSIAGKVIVSLNTENLQGIHSHLNTSLTLGILVISLLTIAISYFLGKTASRLYSELFQKIQSISPEQVKAEENQINWDNLGSSLKSIGDYIDGLQQDHNAPSHTNTEKQAPQQTGSYAELLIECTNFETLQQQISHREFKNLTADFEHKLEQSKVLYHGSSFLISGPYVCLRFYADSSSEPPFQAICCAVVLQGLMQNNPHKSVNVDLNLRMAVHWQEQEAEQLPEILKNHIYKSELEELQFLCSQAGSGEIVTNKNVRQFPSIAEHIKLELISGVSEVDCYRVQKLSDNYQALLNRQIKQLHKLQKTESII